MSAAVFAKIYSETDSQLDRHLSRVKEGRDVDAACFFARWLFWSGILTLLKENSTPPGTPSPLKCDGAFLSWKLNELLQACNEYYQTNRPEGLQATELESLREKVDKLSANLDLLAGAMVQLLQRVPAITPPQPGSAIGQVMDDGCPSPAPRVAGVGDGQPSLSMCHNCDKEENPSKSARFEIKETEKTEKVATNET